MKSIFGLLFIITLSFYSSGQILNEEVICGKWKIEKKVKKNVVLSQDLSALDSLKNKIFELVTTSKTLRDIALMTRGGQWKFNQNEQFVEIEFLGHRQSIIRIFIKEMDGRIMAYLDENGTMVEMKKIE